LLDPDAITARADTCIARLEALTEEAQALTAEIRLSREELASAGGNRVSTQTVAQAWYLAISFYIEGITPDQLRERAAADPDLRVLLLEIAKALVLMEQSPLMPQLRQGHRQLARRC